MHWLSVILSCAAVAAATAFLVSSYHTNKERDRQEAAKLLEEVDVTSGDDYSHYMRLLSKYDQLVSQRRFPLEAITPKEREWYFALRRKPHLNEGNRLVSEYRVKVQAGESVRGYEQKIREQLRLAMDPASGVAHQELDLGAIQTSEEDLAKLKHGALINWCNEIYANACEEQDPVARWNMLYQLRATMLSDNVEWHETSIREDAFREKLFETFEGSVPMQAAVTV